MLWGGDESVHKQARCRLLGDHDDDGIDGDDHDDDDGIDGDDHDGDDHDNEHDDDDDDNDDDDDAMGMR